MGTRISIRRSALALLTTAALTVALAACTPPEPTPTAGPPEGTPTPTESAPPGAPLAPEPVLGATCDDILPAASIAAAFPDALAVADPAHSAMASGTAIVSAYLVRSLGGIACEWNNGEPYSSSRGSNPDYSGVRVLVLPDAAVQWDRYFAYYGSAGVGLYCGEVYAPNPLGCYSNDLIGSFWVEATMFDAGSASAAATLHASILAAVGAAGPGADVWTAPADTLPIPADCEGLVAVSAVQSALGVSGGVVVNYPAGGWSLHAGGDVNASTNACLWSYPDADSGVGNIRVLAAGVWAFTEALPAMTVPAPAAPLALTGLESTDEAWIRCAAGNAECTVDLVIGGNWIEFNVWPDEGFGRVTVDRRAGATVIAQTIVNNLRP